MASDKERSGGLDRAWTRWVVMGLALAGLKGSVNAAWTDFPPAQQVVGNRRLPDAGTLNTPHAIAVDPASGKVFVVDTGHHRVLRFPAGASVANGVAAEAVFGQPDLVTAVPTTSQTGLWTPVSAAVDGGGRLWVVDNGNNRVMRWNHASTATSGAPASVVLGQLNFTNRDNAAAVNRMSQPSAVAADGQGRLWVADYRGSRILRFDQAASKPTGGSADGVLGQPDFTTYSQGLTASQFNQVSDIATDAQGRLWVMDFGNARLLRFDQPAAGNSLSANGVLGQLDFVSNQTGNGPGSLDRGTRLAVSATGTVWVADPGSYRILRWDQAATRTNGAPADGAMGRMGLDGTAGFLGSNAGGFGTPGGMAVDAQGRLWVTDWMRERVVRWDAAASRTNGAPADGVIGRVTLSELTVMPPEVGVTRPLAGLEDRVTGRFFVGDSGRVLRFASRAAFERGDAPQAVLGKTSLFGTGSGSATAVNLRSVGRLAMDAAGRLWVSDPEGNRVVAFEQAATAPTGSAMSRVLGQASFTTSTNGVSATGMRAPMGLALDSGGNLYVADAGNHRVLRFDAVSGKGNGAAADVALGQADLVSAVMGNGAAMLRNPADVLVDGKGRLWVADAGKNRVLRYDDPLTASYLEPATIQLGGVASVLPTGMWQPMALAMTSAGRLWVLDQGFNRVLRFENANGLTNGQPANGVIGAPDLLRAVPGTRTRDQFWRPASVFLDGSEALWVADENNQRLLRFQPDSRVDIVEAGTVPGGKYRIRFTVSGEGRYLVQSSVDLKQWTVEAGYDLKAGAAQLYEAAVGGGVRFFRVFEP